MIFPLKSDFFQSEDEALARALAASVEDSNPNSRKSTPRTPGLTSLPSEDEDAMLARAIAASLEETNNTNNQRSKSDSCHIC